MSIRCPYCAFQLDLKGARAGNFQPKCPRCGEQFSLVVHSDTSTSPVVAKLGVPGRSSARPQAATMAPAEVPGASKGDGVDRSIADALGLDDQATMPPPAPARPNQTQVRRAVDRHDTIAKEAPHEDDNRLPAGTRLGGYEVRHKLGQGGMGAVYLARQLSLDRDVALKTLAPHLAGDPQFVGRFTREAYAAAQLSHHNIVQIHDIGADNGVDFFSMEYVRGRHLGQVVSDHGTLDVDTAVSHTLQAARGLKFAHEHGLVHRDVKPDNLLLSELGIVKVADLGLVKKLNSTETALTAHPDLPGPTSDGRTQLHVSMGTPAYMPPEQAHDAAHVDQRADIYSLGCSLYHLLTGRPPFSGKTALEVITKHTRERVTPPDEVITDLPHALSPIVLKMLAKKPEDRYQTMADVISALEDFLGVKTTGPFTPRNEDLRVLEFAAEKYHGSSWARLRPKVIAAFYAACGLLAVGLGVGLSNSRPALAWGLAGGMVGLAVMTTIAYQITLGLARRTPLYCKARPFIFGAGFVDWASAVAGLCVVGLLLYTFELHGWWLAATVLAVGLAQALYWSIDKLAHGDRHAYVVRAEHLIKQMRLKGVDESTIKLFVCKFSGDHWEAFYEALFGYDEKMKARAAWGTERGRERPKYGAWRDRLFAWLDRRVAERKAIREQKMLTRLEEKMLAAKGITPAIARKQASKNASRLVDKAHSFRATAARHAAAALAAPVDAPEAKPAPADHRHSAVGETLPPDAGARAKPGNKIVQSASSAILDDHPELESDPNYTKQSYFKRRYGTPLDFLLSPQLRLVCGVVLLACFALWWNQVMRPRAENELRAIRAERVDATALVNASKKEVGKAFDALKTDKPVATVADGPVRIAGTDHRLDARLGGFQAGMAGALLVLSALFFGRLLGVLMYASAATALVIPHLMLPVIGFPQVWMVSVAALAVWLLGVLFFRTEPG